VFAYAHQVNEARILDETNHFQAVSHTHTSIKMPYVICDLVQSAMQLRTISLSRAFAWLNYKQLHKQWKDLNLDRQCIILLFQTPTGEIDETSFCLHFLLTVWKQTEKRIPIGQWSSTFFVRLSLQ